MAPAERPFRPEPRRVLLVEDDQNTLELFSAALVAAGFEVDAVQSVTAAMEALAHRTYAVVLSDHGMPDVSGLDSLAGLHGAAPKAARIVCSGDVTEELLAHAREFGVFAVLSKPVSLKMLVVTVDAAARQGRR